jgi:glycosyltransferase involved in cell wall biosynthesis
MNCISALSEGQQSRNIEWVSIVLPVYQDVQAMEELLDRLFSVSMPYDCEIEVVIVDDGSDDEVWLDLKKLKAGLPARRIKLIRLTSNHGQGLATLCGIKHSCGDFVVTMDSDLQHPPEEIPVLIKSLKEGSLDLVYGTGVNGHRLMKRIARRILRIPGALMGVLYYESTSLRGMTRALGSQLVNSISSRVLTIDDLFPGMAKEVGFVSVRHEERKYGKSSYSYYDVALFLMKAWYFSKRQKEVAVKAGLALFLLSIISFLFPVKIMGVNMGLILFPAATTIITCGYMVHMGRREITLNNQINILEMVS